jgi:hypothetical protein
LTIDRADLYGLAMINRVRVLQVVLPLGLLVAACNGSRGVRDAAQDLGGGGADGGAEVRAESGIEVITDAGTDAPADTGTDAPADTGTDAPADTGTDAPADVGTDAPADVGTEAASDAGTDAPADTGSDVAADTNPDAPADVATTDVNADVPAACGTIPTTQTLTSHLRITADNECDVYVNGSKVGSTNNWGVAVTIDVSLFVHPGRRNVIAVRGTNTSSQTGNDRGIIGQLTVDVDGGVAPLVVTNNAWRTSATIPDVDAGGADWTAVDFDDSAWAAATEVASNGDPPWGAVFGTSAAKWIWSAPIPTDTSAKPNLETTYARRTFYFSLDGSAITTTPACP